VARIVPKFNSATGGTSEPAPGQSRGASFLTGQDKEEAGGLSVGRQGKSGREGEDSKCRVVFSGIFPTKIILWLLIITYIMERRLP